MKKIVPLKGKRRFHIVKTIGGDYAIERFDRNSPWAELWGFKNYEEVRRWVIKLNSGRYRLSFFNKNLKKVM